MTVEFIPKAKGCFCFGLANDTFFTLCNTSDIKHIIGEQHTNDPLNINDQKAKQCADALILWIPPEDWYSLGSEYGKKMMIEFFNTCGGFDTH